MHFTQYCFTQRACCHRNHARQEKASQGSTIERQACVKSNLFMIMHQDYKSKIISPRKTFKLCHTSPAAWVLRHMIFLFLFLRSQQSLTGHKFNIRSALGCAVFQCVDHMPKGPSTNAHLNNRDNDETSVLLLRELTLKRCRQNTEVSERDSKAMVSFIPEMPSHYDQVTTRKLSQLGHKHPVRTAPLWVFASNTPRVKLTNKTNEQGQEGCMQEVPAAKHTKTSFMFSKCLLFVSSFSPQEY